MDLKKSIRTLLQTKFGGAQLSAARVEALAKRFEGKVETEEDLEARLTALDEAFPFADIAKEDDRVRTLEAEAKKKADPAPQPEPTPNPAPKTDDKDDPVLALLKEMKGEITALKGEKIATDRKSLILAKLKDADEGYSSKVIRDFGRMSFADDAAFEEYLSDVEADYAAHTQSEAESKLGNDSPFSALGKGGKVKEATEAEVTELFGEIKI